MINDIYEASYQPDYWGKVLESIAELTQSDSAALLHRDNEIQQAGGFYKYNLNDAFIQAYNQAGDDPNFGLFVQSTPIGMARTIDDIIPDRKVLEEAYGEFFQNFMIPHDTYYIAGMILFNDAVKTVAIALQRKRVSGPWPSEDLMQPLTNLAPHLQRALHIHREFVRLEARNQVLQSGLDRLLIGHILIDHAMDVVYCNPAAEAILKEHPALSLRGRKLYAHTHEENLKLYDAVRKAIVGGKNSPNKYANTAIGLRHPDVSTVLPLLVTPTAEYGIEVEPTRMHAYAAIIISNPEQNQPVVPEALMSTYRLTPTESNVAIAIANGLSTNEIAEMLDVKLSTIKSHLKQIYNKTGAKRQTELVKMLLTGPFRVNY